MSTPTALDLLDETAGHSGALAQRLATALAEVAAAQQREAWWRELATIYWVWNRRASFASERQRDDELCDLLGVDGRLLGLDAAEEK